MLLELAVIGQVGLAIDLAGGGDRTGRGRDEGLLHQLLVTVFVAGSGNQLVGGHRFGPGTVVAEVTVVRSTEGELEALDPLAEVVREFDGGVDCIVALAAAALGVEHIERVGRREVGGTGIRTVRIERRHHPRRDAVHVLEDVAVAVRLLLVGEAAADIEREGEGLGQQHVHVGADGVAPIGELRVVNLALLGLELTVLVHVGTRDEVLDTLGTATDAERLVILDGEGLHHQLVPVDVRIAVRIVLQFVVHQFLFRVHRILSVVLERLVVEKEALVRIQIVRVTGRTVQRDRRIELDGRTALFTALGGDEHDAVRSLGTVNGRCSCVIQDGERLDFARVHAEELCLVTLHTVDHIERLGIVPGAGTADVEGGFVGTRLTAALHGDKARDTAGDRVGDVGNRRLDNLVRLHGGNGGGHGRFLLLAECDDHCFLQRGGLRGERHVDDALLADVDHAGLITEETEGKALAPSERQGILTIGVRRSTERRTRDIDIDERERLSRFIFDSTGNGHAVVLRRQVPRDEEHQQGQERKTPQETDSG